VVACAYHPSYKGGIGRRIVDQASWGKKKKKKKTKPKLNKNWETLPEITKAE
jgi:hypothetical protein